MPHCLEEDRRVGTATACSRPLFQNVLGSSRRMAGLGKTMGALGSSRTVRGADCSTLEPESKSRGRRLPALPLGDRYKDIKTLDSD